MLILETACGKNQSLKSCHDDYEIYSDKMNKTQEGSVLGKGTAILCHKTAYTRILKEFSQPNFIAGQLKCPEKKIDLIIIGAHVSS